MNKEIVIFYPYPHAFGGIENIIVNLSKYKKLKVVCFNNKISFPNFSKNKNIKIVELSPKNYFEKFMKLSFFFKKNKFYYMPIMWGPKAAFFAYIANIRKFAVHIDDPPSLIRSFYTKKNFINSIRFHLVNFLTKLAVNKGSFRLTTTKRNAKELSKYYNCEFKFKYPGIFLKSGLINKEKKKIYILSISRIEFNKNIEWIINSLKYYKKKNFDFINKVQVNILGIGSDLDKMNRLINENNLNNQIFLRGFVSEKKKIEFLKKSHISAIPSYQGYGIPALEALRFENRLVINKESRISEILNNNDFISVSENNFSSFRKNLKIQIIKTLHFRNKKFKVKLPSHKDWADYLINNCKI